MQLILDAKDHALERVWACFHVLYLQSAFADVFDPILPPFPIHNVPEPGRQAAGDGLLQD